MKAGDLFPVVDAGRDHRVQATGEFRAPKRGEWYISGAIPEGYRALNDLSTEYHIARLVKIKVVEVVEVIG